MVRKIHIKIFIFALFLSFASPVVSPGLAFFVPAAQAQTTEEDTSDEEKEEINEDIDKIEDRLKKETKKQAALQTDLNQISSSLGATQASIARIQRLLQETESSISSKEKEISTLEKQVTLDRHMLRALIQELYYSHNIPLVEVVMGENDVQKLLQTSDGLFTTQEQIQNLIGEMNGAKERISEEKVSLEDTKEDHATLLTVQNRQKQGLVLEQAEVKDDLAEQEATIAELEEKLSELKGDLSVITGKSYDAKDIKDAIEFVSKKTGVPQGVLYAFLKQETNLGANTGQCTYADVVRISEPGYKKLIKSSKGSTRTKWQNSLNLMERRRDLFENLVDDLGYGKNKKVSCTIAWAKAGPNQGGAMGVAQFMADTWGGSTGKAGYVPRIRSYTGHSTPDPWNLTDGVMAMGLKLKDAGVTSTSSSQLERAVTRYYGVFSRGYYNNVVYWSKNYKKLFK